ncbi:MAG: hypothetical protein IJH84_25640 [Saccharopolyspora sp.]|uniref:hypothetical protein n=1 Tax=Saccharopolyspora TaxID=1835 RepID=UPI00190E4361|nr:MULTISPECIES: hypothetical protein [unclassified Saccharopolyspora]MBK0866928.1 hypothetical protein [Saccharopolyspora sp. HNM0986]MBQ6644394.1 hypothetical protein [Saccharopolyspora sp.]
MRLLRQLAACAALAGTLLIAPIGVAHAGPSSDGHSHAAGPSALNLSNNGDSLLEIDRTLNFNFGGPGATAGSDHDN